MAWNTPALAVTGDPITSSDHNTSVVGNLNQINSVVPVISGGANGATAGGRVLGATVTGSPTGATQKGDLAWSQDGHMYIGTSNGTPGAFADVGAVGTAGNVPLGGLIACATGAAPAGYLLCDGSSLSRTTFSALFSAIGVTWGSVDGNSFNLPDLRGRTIIGVDSAGVRVRPSAGYSASGGEDQHTLNTSEMPAHGHAVTDPGHTHNMQGNISGGGNLIQMTALPPSSNECPTSTTGISIGSAGSGQGHNNMPPYIAIGWYIRAS